MRSLVPSQTDGGRSDSRRRTGDPNVSGAHGSRCVPSGPLRPCCWETMASRSSRLTRKTCLTCTAGRSPLLIQLRIVWEVNRSSAAISSTVRYSGLAGGTVTIETKLAKTAQFGTVYSEVVMVAIHGGIVVPPRDGDGDASEDGYGLV